MQLPLFLLHLKLNGRKKKQKDHSSVLHRLAEKCMIFFLVSYKLGTRFDDVAKHCVASVSCPGSGQILMAVLSDTLLTLMGRVDF